MDPYNPLAFMQAANAKSKARRTKSGLLVADALAQQGQTVDALSGMDAPMPLTGTSAPPPSAVGKFVLPLAGQLNVTSQFGKRMHPIKGTHGFHTGVDLGARQGTPVYAVSDGVVKRATPNGGAYGNQVVVDVGGGLEGMYGHLEKFNVRPGQRVRKGQVIGYVGSTGLSTGPHLHFETWYRGKPVNPNKYLG